MRVIICGSRTFTNRSMVWNVLNGLWMDVDLAYKIHTMRGMTLIEGGAEGADSFAAEWADRFINMVHPPAFPELRHVYTKYPDRPPFEHHHMPADWSQGKKGGPIRNIQMLAKLKEHASYEGMLVVAFVDKPLKESIGTAHMVEIARAAGVTCYVFEEQKGHDVVPSALPPRTP